MSAKVLLGIRREDKNPWERRVPLIPVHVRELMRDLPLEIWVQPSPIRVFADEDFRREGARVSEDLSSCRIVLAVKEIPESFFGPDKVYLFFSHTIKGQLHNMPMLRRMAELRATLIDYERIVDDKGRRLVFFGRQAGLAGMIDTLWALGRRLDKEGLRSPFAAIRKTIDYASLTDAREAVQGVGWEIYKRGLDPALVPLVVGFAGYGHVSQGAQEIFDLLPFEEIRPGVVSELIRSKDASDRKLYKVVFKEEDMVRPKSPGVEFDLQDYYAHPQKYEAILDEYLPHLTVLVNAIYWAPQYPRFVTIPFIRGLWRRTVRPRLRVLGDISCDIGGGIEFTLKSTTPAQPVFTYDVGRGEAVDGFSGDGPVVMAVDNLPAEISLESSIFFSQTLKPFIPELVRADFDGDLAHCGLPAPLLKAVILFRGQFAPDYEYMRSYILPPERSHP